MENNLDKNKTTFQVMLVEPNDIGEQDWANADYIRSVLDTDYAHFKQVTLPDNDDREYLKDLGLLLKYPEFNKPIIESHVIAIEKDYVYEIIYMKFEPKDEDVDNIKANGVGILFDMQGDPVFNNVILQKLYSPLDGSEKRYVDITIKDLEHIMYKRLNTTVIVYEDDEFREEEIPGPTEKFGELFFQDEYTSVRKKELCFLKHNINVWYLTDNQFGNHITGKLLENNPKIFKCAFFSLLTNDRRDNLYLEELKKIIELSNHLEKFTLELNEDIPEDFEILKKNKYQLLWDYHKHNVK